MQCGVLGQDSGTAVCVAVPWGHCHMGALQLCLSAGPVNVFNTMKQS